MRKTPINSSNKLIINYNNIITYQLVYFSTKMLTPHDQNNFKQLTSQYNLSNIAPPPEVYKMKHSKQDQFIQAGPNKRIRRIFYKVTYTPEEEQKIAVVRQKLEKSQIPDHFYDTVSILKQLYQTELNLEQSYKRIKNSYKYFINPTITTFTEKTVEGLGKGYIYTFGRDVTSKPICVITISKYDNSKNADELFNSVYFLMLVIFGMQTVPYHAEKYTMLVDFSGVKMTSLLSYRGLYEIFKQMVMYYGGNLERTIIYNAVGFQKIWHFIKGLVPEYSRKKIVFVDEQNNAEILNYIDGNQLEQKFGGNVPDLQEYWPPKAPPMTMNTANNPSMKTTNNLVETGSTSDDCYSIINDEEFFKLDDGQSITAEREEIRNRIVERGQKRSKRRRIKDAWKKMNIMCQGN